MIQRSTNSFFAKKNIRTPQEKYMAIERDIHSLESLFNDLDKENFDDSEKQVALFAMQGHVQRIYRSIKDLSQSKLDLQDINKLELLKKQLEIISNNISKKISERMYVSRKLTDAESTIVVAGAGPIGYYSAISLQSQNAKHNSNVVLVADKYANFPVRGGAINPRVLTDYAISIGLGKTKTGQEQRNYLQRLMKYITLRQQGDYSIKHLDMLGHATYLSHGGQIVTGMIDWSNIKKDNEQLSAIELTSEEKDIKAPTIHNVKCIVNAMGANATYPKGIKRKELESEDNKQVLRNHCAQVNVTVSPTLLDKLIKLRDYYYSKGNFSFVPFFFHGYSLAPLDQLKSQPEKGILYCKVSDDKTVHYAVKTPTGEVVTDKISPKEFNGAMPPINSPQFTSALLKITTERGHTNFGKQDKDGNYKVQLFPNLTKKESDLLDRIVEQRFKLNALTDSDEIKKEMRILLKTQLFLEFLSFKANIPLGDNSLNLMMLRDNIKSGKHLCREFKVPDPSAPPQEIIKIPGSDTTTTWVGAAALPTIINGRFVPMGVEHAHAVIDHLVDKDFNTGKLDKKTKAGELFQKWVKEVHDFVSFERTNAKDMSIEMTNYFYNYPLAMQANMSATSKMMIDEEYRSHQIKK